MSYDARLLIRADSGPAVGTGHVMRMLALAEAWKRAGGKTAFAAGVLPGTLKKRLESCVCEIHENGPITTSTAATDAQRTLEIAEDFAADWIAADGYVFDDHWAANVSSPKRKLLIMDDFVHATHSNADLVVNQNAYASHEMYPRVAVENVLAGCRYLLMRPEFSAPLPLSAPVPRTEVRRLLVTLGGADPDNVTLTILQHLDCLQACGLEIDVVIGPDFRHRHLLADHAAASRHNVTLLSNVRKMSELMLAADCAITAGGSTTYELARCGVPAVIVSIAENQVKVARELHRRGVAQYAGHFNSFHPRVFVDLVTAFMSDFKERQKMSHIGRALVDGNGAGRLTGRMLNSLFSLRPATIDDAAMILEWRNEPETRAVSFNRTTIDLESHKNWLSAKIADESCRLWIVVDKSGEPVGQIRIEQSAKKSQALISVSIKHEYRGRGLGPVLIRKAATQAVSELPINRIVARIKPFNIASKTAFSKAGFFSIAPTVINDQAALQLAWEPESRDAGLRKTA